MSDIVMTGAVLFALLLLCYVIVFAAVHIFEYLYFRQNRTKRWYILHGCQCFNGYWLKANGTIRRAAHVPAFGRMQHTSPACPFYNETVTPLNAIERVEQKIDESLKNGWTPRHERKQS